MDYNIYQQPAKRKFYPAQQKTVQEAKISAKESPLISGPAHPIVPEIKTTIHPDILLSNLNITLHPMPSKSEPPRPPRQAGNSAEKKSIIEAPPESELPRQVGPVPLDIRIEEPPPSSNPDELPRQVDPVPIEVHIEQPPEHPPTPVTEPLTADYGSSRTDWTSRQQSAYNGFWMMSHNNPTGISTFQLNDQEILDLTTAVAGPRDDYYRLLDETISRGHIPAAYQDSLRSYHPDWTA